MNTGEGGMTLSCPHSLYVNRAVELGAQLSVWQELRSFTHDSPQGPAGGLADRGRHQVILLPYTQVMSLRFGEWSPNAPEPVHQPLGML